MKTVAHFFSRASACAVFALTLAHSAWAGNTNDVVPEVKAIASLPDVVRAVKEQNAKKLSMDFIKNLDGKWIAANGEIPEAKAILGNPVSKLLLDLEKTKPYFKEMILTDNQGANVAMSNTTSDYWQGDEPKFVNTYAQGKGADFIARAKKDDSSGEVISQVSVPVMEGGAAIGTLTIGVRVNALH